MILGYALGQLVIFFLFSKSIKNSFQDYSFRKIYFVASKYRHYPKFLIPATLASEISGSLPLIIIGKIFSIEYIGFFSLAVRITTTPMTFIGNSIGEVYRQKAADEYRLKGECKKTFITTFRTLFAIGSFVFLCIYFFSSMIVPIIFGSNWNISAKIMEHLAFLVFFQLLSTPLSYTITFNKSQKYDMILQIFRGIFSIGSLYLGNHYGDFFLSLKLYVCVYCIYYILHSYLQYRSAIGLNNSIN
jgi:O-antigen/teichoic acid export membrane protein